MEDFYYRNNLFDNRDIVRCRLVFVFVIIKMEMKLEMELRHLFHIVLDKLACADCRMF